MTIFIQSPNINSRHGGIRVINEWANRLHELGHRVILYNQAGAVRCDWMELKCKIVNTTTLIQRSDCLIVTSPHGAFLLDKDVKKKFVFLQMLEHLFNPMSSKHFNNCLKLYTTRHPLIAISKWNIKILTEKFKRTGPTHYVGNGVNLDDFPISYKPKEGKVILLESPEPTNPSKDTERIAIQVSKNMIELGWTIKGFGIRQPKDKIFTEFVVSPDLGTMNRLYEEATLLLKATRYDARSTAPLEAMTKGTVTVRGLVNGDDDLTEENSYRCGYSCDELFDHTKMAINDQNLHLKADKCREYVQTYTWDYWIKQINQILTQ